jgi:trimethyllysine dioxygenase
MARFRPILWGSKIEKAPPSVSYEEAMAEDDQGLFKWLSNVVCREDLG